MAYPSFYQFGTQPLDEILDIRPPPLAIGRDPLRQLKYIEHYVKKLECRTVLIEVEYIDRDYIEDHSIFYSRNRQSLPNYCTRVHFFRGLTEEELRKHLEELVEACAKDASGHPQRCAAFSKEFYLGFMVVKPLHGCPVGRTVLRTFPPECDDPKSVREFRGSLRYEAHLLGVGLAVFGLAFQQQDEGVSACATTAIWSSLQKLRSTEEVSAATPAQITMLASRFSLPFGRPMPAEGLNLDQMCQSIHALSISPDLLRTPTYEVARGVIYAAALSDTTPILIISHPNLGRHAVTVAGVKRRREHEITPVREFLDDRAGDLLGLYLHDDRIGPYVKAELIKSASGEAKLKIEVDGKSEEWHLTHVLTPIHTKVRLSFSQIRRIAYDLAVMLYRAVLFQGLPEKKVSFGVRILRAHTYVQKLLTDSSRTRREEFFSSISMSRYVGLIRLEADKVGPFNILVDTTGTPRNARCLGIVNRGESNSVNKKIGSALAAKYGCPFVE